MSDTINDGGPALPVTFEGGKNNGETPYFAEGMSLRAYFAGQAMAGFCSMHDETGLWSWDANDAAKEAVRCADALIAELSKGGAA